MSAVAIFEWFINWLKDNMPLHKNAEAAIRKNLEDIAAGKRVAAIIVGSLAVEQLATINEFRASEDLPAINGQIFFVGRHVYKSRVVGQGYTIDDVMDQIISGMSHESVVQVSEARTALQNPKVREDRYGNKVHDKVTLECTAKNPLAELLSTIPIGDLIRPKEFLEKIKGAASATPVNQSLTNSPG